MSDKCAKSRLTSGTGGHAQSGSAAARRNVSPAGPGGPALQNARAIGGRRTLVTLLLGTLLTVPTGLYRQRGEGGLPACQYDALRRNWLHCADVVLAGDSRVQRGVCPAVMTPPLRAQRVLNFAYPNCALVSDYLDRVEEVLDPRGGRSIVIGVTPHSLTARAARVSEFLVERERPALRLALDPIEWLFEPYSLEVLSRRLCGQPPRGASYLSADGWRGATAYVIDTDQESRRLRDLFERGLAGTVSPALIDGLLARVSRWARLGIRVYAFRPPTTAATVALEDKLYRFDLNSFTSRFEAAGGVWIDIDPAAYATYDGNHLQGTAAVLLSADLGRAVYEFESRTASAAGRPERRDNARPDPGS